MNAFISSFSYKLIYIFEIRDEVHKGLLKIGDATIKTDASIDELAPNCHALNQAAKDRIRQYTNTAGISFNLLHTELAVRNVPDKRGVLQLRAFRDHHVHRVLDNSGISRIKLKGSTSREWFDVSLATAKDAIAAVKMNQENLSGTVQTGYMPIIFRPEQEDAIDRTIKQFKKSNRMLWNAKMRFGKTITALEVIRRMQFKKSIIFTHRPVVDNGWYGDFKWVFNNEPDYLYGSKNTGNSISSLLDSGKNFVYFCSIQDLRGSEAVGGKFVKNDIVFDTEWDFVIVDEAHEGTTTALGNEVVKKIVKESTCKNTKFLALSGTPFNILGDYEDNVYTWDYIMEQSRKKEWAEKNFGDSNPYEELPELRIYTYDLGSLIESPAYVELEDKAFNFREFFRTWTGDKHRDRAEMPDGVQVGDFVHEDDIKSFLDLITRKSDVSEYPYSNEEYRELFQHSLWMIPGVREGKALSKLLKSHPVFGSGLFNIINVAGDGDNDEEDKDAYKKVRNAIDNTNDGEYTITLSCGKLTTGVTVPEWTAVFMLSGSFSTSAANYLQTIFRVQSPCNKNGKIKTTCYVFDFAPDRTLKMIAESVTASSRAGKTSETDRRALGYFLNYCPVIALDGTVMKPYNTNRLLQQLKRAYAERAVQNGFDDSNLYSDELLKLDDIQIDEFNNLKKIVGKSKASLNSKELNVNDQGFTDEEYEEIERINKKPAKERTPEELTRLEEAKKKKKQKKDAISILRGISIRMPLLIYGADIDFTDDFTLDMFLDDEIVDKASWAEFMPSGVTKPLFKKFMKYYDPEIFVAAGRRIRNIARSADELSPTERVKKIADLFSCFKNPDKETVLTPWRVVNMHLSDCLGGYDFFDKDHKNPLDSDEPRFVDRGTVTESTLSNTNASILEINSKTGLYPLYVAYSLYRAKLADKSEDDYSIDELRAIWDSVVDNSVFVICKTPMAKSITRRTLMRYRTGNVNAHYFDDLINYMENKPEKFVSRVLKKSYWKKGSGKMNFDAVVGNPPYQSETGGGSVTTAATQAKPIFHMFVDQAKALSPSYVSMIIPARWYNGGIGLNDFRKAMLNDSHFVKLLDYSNSKELFPTVDIAGGICYFLWDASHDGECLVINSLSGERNELKRKLSQFGDFFIRSNSAIPIIDKVLSKADSFVSDMASAIDTFGISSKEKGHEDYQDGDLLLLHSVGANGQGTDYVSPNVVKKNSEMIGKFKIKISILVPQNGEVGVSPEKGYRSISSPQVLYPGTVDTFSYLNIGFFDTELEALNFRDFMTCKLPRFMMRVTYSSVHISKTNFMFVPMMDFTQKWTDEKLYDYFDLSETEREIIEKTMRPLVLEKGDIGKEYYETHWNK